MEVRQPPATSTTTRLIALAIAVGIVVLVVSGVQSARKLSHSRVERETFESLAGLTAALAAATEAAVAAVDATASRSTTTGGPESVAGLAVDAREFGVASVVWHPKEGSIAAGKPDNAPELEATLAIARDQARLRLSPPFRRDGRRVIAAVRPVYRQDDVFTVDGGFGASGQRRERLAGWVVGFIPTDPLVKAARVDTRSVEVSDAGAVVSAFGTGEGFVATTALSLAGRVWTLRVASTASSPVGRGVWLPGGVGVALIGVLVGAERWRAVRARRQAEHLDGLQSQLAMIADVAPVVQQTLELGDVLPAVAVRLTDRLALAGVSFTFVDDHGRHTEIFAYGQPTNARVTPATALPDGVPSQTDIALALRRGGRVGGVVRARTTRPLSATECAGLAAVAEMISSALMTARTFEQQAEAVKRLSELDALKSTFLETASHELRTPVTAIAGFARLTHEQWDELPEAQRRLFVERIWANASVLDNLVADLLNFSRMERGGLQPHNEPVTLSDVVPEVIGRLSPIFDTHRINSHVVPGVVVSGERRGIEQILTNLLSNAVKFSPVDSAVAVRLEATGGRAVLTVDDEGPGVPEAERERVFSRFFRGRDAVVIRTRGAGIGLSVVKALADQMDATIEVGASPSGGARFSVSFPIASIPDDVMAGEDSHVTQP